MNKLSVVLITFQEEKNVARCLEAVRAIADEIVVVDSYSTDKTLEIVKSFGAVIHQRPFESYADQRDYASKVAAYDLVLALDADEVVSPELANSIIKVKENMAFGGYELDRINQFAGKWIKHGSWYPDYKLRLFDRRKVTFSVHRGHDEVILEPGAKATKLAGYLYHYTAVDLKTSQAKMNVLSSLAAEALFDKGKKFKLWRLMVKPPVRFFSEYFIKKGFLDGFYGYLIAKTSSYFVFQREMKLWEMWQVPNSEKNGDS